MPATWSFHVGATTYTLAVESWSVARSRRDGTVRWSVTLAKDTYWPAGSVGQYFEPYERIMGTFGSWVTCTLTSGAYSWSSPQLAILDVAWDQQPDGLRCEIGGTDIFAELLQYEGVALGDRRSTSSTVYTARGVCAEICEACGIDSGAIETGDMTDYNIPVFHAVGQGQSLLRDLMELLQGWLYPDEGSLRFKDGGLDPDSGSSDLTLNQSNSKAVQYRKSSTAIYNRVTFERTSETKYGFGPELLHGYGAGQEITFDPALNEAHVTITPFGQGTPENGVFQDASGTPLTVSPTFSYRGTTPAAKFVFTLTPSVAWGANPMTYLAEAKGHNSIDEVAPFDADYSYTHNDSADQAVRGLIPAPDPFITELCPDQATAEIAAERKVKEALLSYTSLNVDLVMDVRHDPAQRAACTYPKLGLSSKRFLVESVQWSGDANQEVESLELSRGAA